MLRLTIAFAIAAIALPATAQTIDAPLTTATDAEEGEYIVDGSGMSLYLFKADTRGPRGTEPKSACNDAPCMGTWPPLLTDGTPVGDDKLDSALLGTFKREDGTMQVTYNGWPLYYYYEDGNPGDILGDDIESFGEDWYLIGPHGDRPGREDDRDDDRKDDRD